MRYLALDIGEKRTGIAVSDASGRIASPVAVLPSQEVTLLARSFKRILDDYQPQVLVVGLPLSLDGRENSQAAAVRGQAEHIAQTTGLPLEFSDERFSSAQAKRLMRASGQTERFMRGKTDKIAASLFLQAHLDLKCALNGDAG